jgi:large subunit ribosomal protein L18
MKTRKKFAPYRRKQDGRTNYRKRLKLLVSGIPRMVVRKTNKHIIVQIVQYSENGDHVVLTANSSQLKKQGWKYATGNLPAAYLTGALAGKLSQSKKIKKAIVDIGLQTPAKGSRLYAVVKGAIDSGMEIPCSEEAFPSEDRIRGKHIQDYSKISKQFKTVPSDIEKAFEDLKSKIIKG